LTSIAAAAVAAALAGCGSVPDRTAAPQDRAGTSATSAAPSPSGSKPTSAIPSAEASEASKAPSTAPASRKPAKSPAKETPKPAAVIFKPGDEGTRVRELQARLKQLDWYTADVTDQYDDRTTTAVKGFQQKRELPGTGTVDAKTWSRLVAMTKEPTHDQLYNIVHAGPAILDKGDQSQQVRQLQARLKQLDWFSEKVTGFYGSVTTAAVRGFQDKRGLPTTGAVDQATWDRLVAMTREPTAAELSGETAADRPVSTGQLDPRCLTGRAMCIDKTTDQLVWVIDGKPQLHFDVRFGADTTPTREGSFAVGWKARDWTSTLYHSEMPYSMFFSGGQAVHYSSDFAARGYNGASHGCVNVRDYAGIQNLFGQVRVGDKVIVYRS
jgi:peptidoglycan hydrolase-like protein with peptidoglycan-binding domain